MDVQTAWDAYWRDARGAACQADESGRYRGEIARLWREWFLALRPHSRILDLATGNGAVIELAVECLREDQLPVEFHGIDNADIRPRIGDRPRPGVRCHWHADTSIESLPFDESSFDGITSQYGVEYGELAAAVTEASRVLKPGGWLVWICHWRAGDLARDTGAEVDQAKALEALDLPGKVADLVRAQVRDGTWIPDSHRATAGMAVARRTRAALGKAFTITGSRPGQEGGNLSLFLHNLAWLYQHRERHSVETVLEKLAECTDQLRFHKQRLSALVRAALTPERLAELKSALSSAGLELREEGPVVEPSTGRTVAYRLFAVKPGSTGHRGPADGSSIDAACAKSQRSDWHWSEYWRRGPLTTFDRGRYQSGYDGAVAAFWEQVFTALPDGAVLVDLATGNGAIPLLAARYGRAAGRQWDILGLDYADIRIPAAGDEEDRVGADLAGVDFRPHTSMERTGLPGAVADLVTSQFGIEYGDLERTLSEIARILKRPGKLALVMHHPDSAVVQQAHRNLHQTRLCLGEERLDRKIAELVRMTDDRDDEETDQCRRRLDQSLARIRNRIGDEDDTYLSNIVDQLLRVFGDLREHSSTDKLAYIEQCSEAMSAYIARMESMAAASLDAGDFDVFLAQMEDAGFTHIEAAELRDDRGVLIGRTVTARIV